jgi:hypothetical protein
MALPSWLLRSIPTLALPGTLNISESSGISLPHHAQVCAIRYNISSFIVMPPIDFAVAITRTNWRIAQWCAGQASCQPDTILEDLGVVEDHILDPGRSPGFDHALRLSALPQSTSLLPQTLRNRPELLQHRLQFLHDLGRQRVRLGHIGRLLQRLVAQPKDVQVDLVAGQQFLVGERAPATFPRGAQVDLPLV